MKKWIKNNPPNASNLLEDKIRLCRKLVIQSMQKTIQHKMFYMYLKDQEIQNHLVEYRVNSTDGIIKLTFHNPEQAMNFYQERSFKDCLLLRKFNIYFDLSASQDQVKKYFLRGVTEQKMRFVFEKCKQYGVVRLNTLYTYNKMKDTCIVCLLRKAPLSPEEFKTLSFELQCINVMLDHYKDKQGNISYIRQNQSQIKVEKKIELKQENNEKEQCCTITLITIHNKHQDQVRKFDKQIIQTLKKVIESDDERIWIDRFNIPTLNPRVNRVVLLREVEFASEKAAKQKFQILTNWIRQNYKNSMIYLNQSNQSSTLVTFRPTKYVFKAKDGKLSIFSKTEEKEKLIRLAEINYQEIDEFIFQEDRVKINFYKGAQIDVFGEPIEQIKRNVQVKQQMAEYDDQMMQEDFDDDWQMQVGEDEEYL